MVPESGGATAQPENTKAVPVSNPIIAVLRVILFLHPAYPESVPY